MTKTLFSRLLQKDVTLDGEALAFYDLFEGKDSHRYRQYLDASHYITLADLGYTVADHLKLFTESGGRRAQANKIAANKVPPVVASYGYRFLRDDGSSVQPGTWFSEAMASLDAEKITCIDDLVRAGWSEEHAFIIAAFPDREARLQEAVDTGMQYYDLFLGTSYDLEMIRRLIDVPGVYFLYLKDILDKGFTEAEIKGFGFNATHRYTVNELRSVKIKPSFFKNITSAFPLHEWKPTVDEVEALFSAGVKNGKQYKDFARTLGLKVQDKKTVDAVATAANILSREDALKLFQKTGPIPMSEIEAISRILEDDYTIDEYLTVLDSLDEETETQFRVGVSMATTARNALNKGLTPQEISEKSKKGTPLAQM